MQYEDEDYDLELSEEEKAIIESKDWPALLELRKGLAESRPEDLLAWQRYTESLNLNKMHKEAIDAIEPFYRENYDFGFGIFEIIDVFLGMGKTEDDFDWIEKPEVVKLNDKTLDFCIKVLKRQGGPVSIYSLFEAQLAQGEYLAFHIKEFLEFLTERSEIFELFGDPANPMNMEVSLKN